MNTNSAARPTKNVRRQQAREQAKLAREAQQKRDKRNRLLIQGGVATAIIALLAIAAIVITNSLRPAGPAAFPANMASGGVVFGKDLQVQKTAQPEPGEAFVPTTYNNAEKPLHVRVFADFMCPACGSFEQTYGKMLEQYTGAGDIKLEIQPINFLDPQSAGTKYSTRAANLFACVVDQQPDNAYPLFKKLFEVQPKEGTTGIPTAQLLDHAAAAGVERTEDLNKCVNKTTFAPFIDRVTQQVLRTEVLGLAEGAALVASPQTGELQDADKPQLLVSTPTVIINGEQWYQPRDGDLEQFILKKLQDAKPAASN